MKYFSIGQIISTQGNNGEVKVFPLTDDINRFRFISEVYVKDIEGNHQKYKVLNVKKLNNRFIILKFKEIDKIEEAETFIRKYIEIKKEELINLPKNHYFIFEIINCSVYTFNGDYIGKIKDVIQTGANDVYVLKNNNKEVLIPAVKEIIKIVNIKEKKIIIEPIKGLL